MQKYIDGSVLKHWTVVLEGKDNVELLCSWAGHAPRVGIDGKLAQIGFVGDVQLDDGLEMRNSEPIGLDGRGSGLLSKYDEGISNQEVRNLIAYLIQTLGTVQDSLPKDIVDDSGVLSLEDALREAHFPSNQNIKDVRCIFEEVSSTMSAKDSTRSLLLQMVSRMSYNIEVWHSTLGSKHPVVRRARSCIVRYRREMFSPEPMRRLLQGDVGSGKPMVALFTCLCLICVSRRRASLSETTCGIFV